MSSNAQIKAKRLNAQIRGFKSLGGAYGSETAKARAKCSSLIIGLFVQRDKKSKKCFALSG